MNWKINDLIEGTQEQMRRGYWKITSVSFLMILLTFGVSYSSLINSLNELPELVRNVINTEFAEGRQMDGRMVGVLLTLTGGMLLLSTIVKLFMDVFLENPLEIGADRMFLSAMDEKKPVMLADLMFAYDSDYINSVKVLFLKKFFRDMWMLLLLVPGIVKGYEYRCIPYLLSEDPYMDYKEAFAKSKGMMNGHKMEAFKIDLYFIPWHILGLFTLGIAEIFYVAPKQNMVKALFYLKVKEAYETAAEETAA